MKIKSSKNQYEMQDPTKQYRHPEFPEQTQPTPGWRGKWTRSPITARRAIRDSGDSRGAKL